MASRDQAQGEAFAAVKLRIRRRAKTVGFLFAFSKLALNHAYVLQFPTNGFVCLLDTQRSFLDDLLAGGASGGGVGSAAFLPYSTRTHASAAEAVVATRSSSEARASGSVAGSNSSGGMSTVKEAGEGLHTDVETPSKNSADGVRPFGSVCIES